MDLILGYQQGGHTDEGQKLKSIKNPFIFIFNNLGGRTADVEGN